MLFAEGLTGAEEHDVRQMPLTADVLRDRQAVIVAPCGEDTGAEAAALEALRQGTPVVFLRPSAATAAELGIRKSSGARRMKPISRRSETIRFGLRR